MLPLLDLLPLPFGVDLEIDRRGRDFGARSDLYFGLILALGTRDKGSIAGLETKDVAPRWNVWGFDARIGVVGGLLGGREDALLRIDQAVVRTGLRSQLPDEGQDRGGVICNASYSFATWLNPKRAALLHRKVTIQNQPRPIVAIRDS